MDNQAQANQIETGESQNVTVGDFPMFGQPIPYQLTIHVNNLFTQYDKTMITNTFKNLLENPEYIGKSGHTRINQIIDYYGVDLCRDWFTLVYGWQFGEIA